MEHILAVHPSSKGFGYALFDAPLFLADWGLIRTSDNNEALHRLEHLLATRPVERLILEEHEGRRRRVKSLFFSIIALAGMRGLPVRIITREETRRCFSSRNARTREEVSRAVSALLPELSPRLPPHRKPWMPEDPRLALFSAAALGVAHFAHPEIITNAA